MGTGTCRSICWDPSAARKTNWTVSAAERHERWGQSVGIRDPDTIPLIAAAEGGWVPSGAYTRSLTGGAPACPGKFRRYLSSTYTGPDGGAE